MKKLVVVLFVVALAVSAAGKAPKAPVRVTSSPDAVADCRPAGPVSGHAAGASHALTGTGMLFVNTERLAWERLEDDARDAGANAVLLVAALADGGAVIYRGEAYACEVTP